MHAKEKDALVLQAKGSSKPVFDPHNRHHSYITREPTWAFLRNRDWGLKLAQHGLKPTNLPPEIIAQARRTARRQVKQQ